MSLKQEFYKTFSNNSNYMLTYIHKIISYSHLIIHKIMSYSYLIISFQFKYLLLRLFFIITFYIH